MKTIVQADDPVLRAIAKDVPEKEITSLKIQRVIKEMKEALASQDDGVALAAPQIGYSLRMFVLSPKVPHLARKQKRKKKEEDNEEDLIPEHEPKVEHIVFINPVITKLSKEKKIMEEGCLSVRYLYGEVKRSEKASIEALDEKGRRFTKGASGLLAQIFQHEVDHLNGVLFIDKAKYLQDLPPAHVKKARTQQ